jgi:hypothetical protein
MCSIKDKAWRATAVSSSLCIENLLIPAGRQRKIVGKLGNLERIAKAAVQSAQQVPYPDIAPTLLDCAGGNFCIDRHGYRMSHSGLR